MTKDESTPTASPMENAVRSEITNAIINSKVNVCPFSVRLAWHASGTYDKNDKTPQHGGPNGATMRFRPEITDEANAGMGMMQNILRPVKERFPELSYADLWTLGGVQAIKLLGGPDIPFKFGRTDDPDGSNCPINGRLPSATDDAAHLRKVFYRMGFDDKEIVVLSGGHTLGSCHEGRSGYDGPWTSCPIKFDNEYFRNLVEIKWKPRVWEGPLQYTDPEGKFMMLPSDIALIRDPAFRTYAKIYASSEQEFFDDFSVAFSKLISLGCPQIDENKNHQGKETEATKTFRIMAMHGNLVRMKMIKGKIDPSAPEYFTKRTALHKASYFGHHHVVEHILSLGGNVVLLDVDGDTPLHDAAKLGHVRCAEMLLDAGAKFNVKNRNGETPLDLAQKLDCKDCYDVLKKNANPMNRLKNSMMKM